MRARFIGDPKRDGEGPKTLRRYGLEFTYREWAGIDGLQPHEIAKLQGNDHWEVDSGKAAVKPADPVEARREAATGVVADNQSAAVAPKNKGGRPRKVVQPVAPPPPPEDDDDFKDLD